jgi:hypothetical protein
LGGLLGGLLGRKLHASTSTHTAASTDTIHIERTSGDQGSEHLPARPQQHSRLRRMYKHKCRPDQPCGPASLGKVSRSYKITAKPT